MVWTNLLGELRLRLTRGMMARGRSTWIDLALIDNENDLAARLESMGPGDRRAAVTALKATLGITEAQIQAATLRLLVERARPLALPAIIWKRQPLDTWSVRDAATQYLEANGIEATDSRLRAMQSLFARFVETRAPVRLAVSDLARQNYACWLCGLRFYNEELVDLGFVSPLGNRPKAKVDPLKPHWSRTEYRKPSADHEWPVSLYGSNARTNIKVVCSGCNEGKANYLALHQTRAFVGLPIRTELSVGGAVHPQTFYAQLLRQPTCQTTGRGASATELTVRLKNLDRAAVLDNLETVASAES